MNEPEPTHRDILIQIHENARDIKGLRADFEQAREADKPIQEFFQDMQTMGRIGRAIRLVLGWIVVFAGTLAILWATVSNSLNRP